MGFGHFRLLKLPVKITEFKLLGTLRFMLAPVIDEGPYVKAMTFSFLKPPDLNYGTLQAVFIPLSRIPGLASFIDEAINGSLVMFTWPSTMPIPFTDMTAAELAAISRRSPSGLLRVKFVRATNLRGVDLDGKSTPYVNATLGTQKHACKPKRNTINPTWNYAAEFIVHDKDTDTLDIFIMDKDTVGKDTLLGRVQFELADVPIGRQSLKQALTDSGGRKSTRAGKKRAEIELVMEYMPFHTKETPYTANEATDALDPTWTSETAEAKPRGLLQKFDVFSMQPSNGKLFIVVKNLWCVPSNADKPVQVIIKFGDLPDDLLEHPEVAQKGPPAHETYPYAPRQLRQQDLVYYPNSPNQAHHLYVAYEETVCLPVNNVHTDKLAVFVKGLPKSKRSKGRLEWLCYTTSVSDKLQDGANMSVLQINDGNTVWDNAPDSEVQLELTMTLLYAEHDDPPPTMPAVGSTSNRLTVPGQPQPKVTPPAENNQTKMNRRLSSATKRTRDTIQSAAEQQSGDDDDVYRLLPATQPMNKLIGITTGTFTVVYLSGYFLGWGFFGWLFALVALSFYGRTMLQHAIAVRALQTSPNASWVRRVQTITAEVECGPAESDASDSSSPQPSPDMIEETSEEKHCDNLGQARVSQELPRWVKSPAIEKVTWINEILEALWPKITAGVTKQVRDQVETQIEQLKESKPFLKQCILDLEEFDLGELPLLIDGVQHYDNQLEGDRIHLDFDLRMATNLAVAIRVGVHRLLSVSIAVRNVAFEGTMRVELSPLVSVMPCFGSASICFMDVPKIDFDIFIGDFSVLATPFLWYSARQFLETRIADMVVFPNKIVSPVLSEEQLRTKAKPPGAGILRVHLESALGLRNADLVGKSDPMCCMVLHDEVHEQTLTSSTKQNDLNPVWDEVFEFVVANPNANFEFHLYDVDDDIVTSKVIRKEAGKGLFGKDHLGSASMPFQDFPVDTPIRHIIPLLTARKKRAGSLTVTATWKPFLDNPEEDHWDEIENHCTKLFNSGTIEEEEEEEGGKDPGHIASIGVLYANIRNVEDLDQRAAKVRGIINNQQETVELKNASGVLNSNLRLGLLVENPKYDKFVLEVLTGSGDVLGSITKPVSEFSDGKMSNRSYAVEGSRGSVMLQMALRVTNPSTKELVHFHHGMKSIGVLRVKVISAKGLRNVERFSKSDPYVLMSFQESDEVSRTAHVPNNLNPEWNAIFEFPLSTKADVITFAVKDHEDKTLGVKGKEAILGIDVQHIAALPKDTLVRREYFLRGTATRKSKTSHGSLLVDLEWKEFSEELETAALENTAALAKSQNEYFKASSWNSAVLFGRLTSLAGLTFKKPRITITASTGGGPSEDVQEFDLPSTKSLDQLAHPIVVMLPAVDATVTITVTDGSKSRDSGVKGVCSLELADYLGSHDKPREYHQWLKWTGPSSPKVEFKAELLVKTLSMERVGEIGKEDRLALPTGNSDRSDGTNSPDSGDADTTVGDVPMYPTGGGHLKFEVLRLRGFDSAPGGTEPNVYVSCRISTRQRRTSEFGLQKQKTDAVKSANPKFTKNNVFDFTVGDPKEEWLEIHAKTQEALLASFRSKGRLADVNIPIEQLKIGGDYTPGSGALEQEFMFESGKQSGYVVLKIIEWLPAELTAVGVGAKTSIARESSSAALQDDSVSISSAQSSPFKRSPRGSRRSALSKGAQSTPPSTSPI